MAMVNFDFSFIETKDMSSSCFFLKSQFYSLFLYLFAWYEHDKTSQEAQKKKKTKKKMGKRIRNSNT